MDERDWTILMELYEKKNITKTAQSLYISQPTLTKRIQHIEQEYKVSIINRGTKGVQFTPQGEYLAKCAKEMIKKLQNIKETVLNMEEEVTGTLRLGVSNYIATHKLPGLLKQFQVKFPKVNYKVTTGWSQEVFTQAYHRDVQIGIVRGDYQWPESKLLLFEEYICITSTQKIELEDLPSLPRIDYETDTLLLQIIDNWWSRTFSQPPLIGMEVDKGVTCKEMVMNGLGYGILPSALIDDHPELYTIYLTDEQGKPLVRKTWLFYHEDSLKIKVINEFVRFIEQSNVSKMK
ncbi:LysR family transcriptional regulator [Halalkalibacter akibai]|uniref:Transcriptional regulator n=1 Tax=Halalkalibacter akibai (strain ATCC 43226 / DSM 21942 / CIP 109018 / JCM 9157 / 1139) TaxID=1236973 RepID=W4QWF7_HALA3|nr:LysR family transcriptional regulator [Halalkalibacter akibai]GAE35978.1 transcriptional regulator [Halalkalibacter akibai JCM 9157]